ncbi:MAG: hypothetical protein ACPLRM_00500 [Anaerolineae bacterium]
MGIVARKLSFQEVWDTITVFLVDEELEKEIEQEVDQLLALARKYGFQEGISLDQCSLASLLVNEKDGLDLILREIELSEEKFLRIVSLLRRIGRIPGEFDSEWSLAKVKRMIISQKDFADQIVALLLDGKNDHELQQYVPKYYLEALNLREIAASPTLARRVRYKRSLIGTYSGRKGYKVEAKIRDRLIGLGVRFEQGRSRFVDTDIDFAIPSLEDPWVIVMSSFQETTSSGQSTKARDMLTAFERINRSNARYGENRAFVNFVDGGGWLARKHDLRRLEENCHYFINLHHLDMLEDIVEKHVPAKYVR